MKEDNIDFLGAQKDRVFKSDVKMPMEQEFSKENSMILLLHGPPGTGKTTMAKVLAKHCGYEVRHVNASDKRNRQEIMQEIKNAIMTDGHFTKIGHMKVGTRKPTCLILDEIDGVLGGGIEQTRGIGLVAWYLK